MPTDPSSVPIHSLPPEQPAGSVAALFEYAPMALLLLTGPGLRVEIANSKMQALLRRPADLLVGAHLGEIFPLAKVDTEALQQVAAGNGCIVLDEVAMRGQEEQPDSRYVKLTIEPLNSIHGSQSGVVVIADDISSHVAIRKQAEQNSLRLKVAMEAASIGTFDWDIRNDTAEFSARTASLFGFAGTDGLVHQDLIGRIHPEDRAVREKAFDIAAETGSAVYELRVVWPDGSTHWIRVNGALLFDAAGKPYKMYGTVLDIDAERLAAERLQTLVDERTRELVEQNRQLEKSEERYHRMVDEVQEYAIILLDREGFIQNWSRGAEKIKQYKESEAVGRHFEMFYLPEDRKDGLPNKLLSKAVAQGKAIHEGWRIRKDGTRFWGSISLTALHDQQENVIGFSKVTRDLTDKKEAEDQLRNFASALQRSNEELRRSEERYQKMTAEVQDYAIILLDENGDIQNWNAGAARIKGYTASEILGKNFRLFYTAVDRERRVPERLMQEAITQGKAIHEGWRQRKDGTTFWGSVVITALHGDNNRIIGFSKVTRDLTEKKIAEDKMREYLKELEVQNKELEQFAYVASHDLQEPLRKIRTFADIILNNLDDRQAVEKYMQKIDVSARRMSDLIRSVLDYSRLARNEDRFAVVDLNETLDSVRADFELMIQEKGATIKSPSLPAINGIPLQISQLFSNLIGNALKFNNKIPVITIQPSIVSRKQIAGAPELLADGYYLELVFSDNGIGFEPQYEKLIFSMFQRLHGKHEYAGTGIGLALCKKIMDNHQGYIKATGEQDKGAIFSVYFPISPRH